MIFGIVVLALPITVIGSNFHSIYDEYNQKKEAKEKEEKLDNLLRNSNTVTPDSPSSIRSDK